MVRRKLLLIGAMFLLACADRDAVLPAEPVFAAFITSSCELGVSDAAARLRIATLVESIDALEAAGELTSGQANALRGHLANVLRQIDAGNYCAALAQLQAFADQVRSFIADGVLTLDQGEPLLLTVTQVMDGPPNLVTVDPPSTAAGTYEAGTAAFGPAPTVDGTSGSIVLVDDGTAARDDGCSPLVGFPAGAIALVKRGTCTFVEKVLNAQAAGAVAVIVQNNFEDGSNTPPNIGPGTGMTFSISIPTVTVTLAAGETIRAGLPATGTVSRKPAT